jgi:hypothetical protein
MGDLADLGRHTQVTSLGTSPTIYNVTDATDTTFPTSVRFIRATGAGAITFIDANGVSKTGQWAAGETRAVAASAIVGASTTATGVEGMP